MNKQDFKNDVKDSLFNIEMIEASLNEEDQISLISKCKTWRTERNFKTNITKIFFRVIDEHNNLLRLYKGSGVDCNEALLRISEQIDSDKKIFKYVTEIGY